MSPNHPSPTELLDLLFGELEGHRRAVIEPHARRCPVCQETLADLDWLQSALAALPEQPPPADGLERVLEAVLKDGPVTRRRAEWLAPVAAGLAGVGVSIGAIYATGTWLLSHPLAARLALPQSAGALPGLGLGALAFFGIGSFVTLALAPVLLIEAQSRVRRLAAR